MTKLTDIKAVVNDRSKKELLEGLKDVIEEIKEADTAESMLVMIKLNGNYVRFSSQLNDTMALIAQLELLKFDIMKRMKQED